jgi:hypothetical protein
MTYCLILRYEHTSRIRRSHFKFSTRASAQKYKDFTDNLFGQDRCTIATVQRYW